MIRFTLDLENNELVLDMEPPYVEEVYARTTICVQPDPCPGCGNCLLCDSKCTCHGKVEGVNVLASGA